MGVDKDFQKRVQKIGSLVQDLESIADPASRAAAKELVQSLMDLHGTGLERILEMVFESGEWGPRIIDELGQDPLVSSLLICTVCIPTSCRPGLSGSCSRLPPSFTRWGRKPSWSASTAAMFVCGCESKAMLGSTSRTVQGTVEEAIYGKLSSGLSDVASHRGTGRACLICRIHCSVRKLIGAATTNHISRPGCVVGSEGMD